MSALKLHTLKQKLWAIVVASFVARVVMFFILPNTPSTMAPDEGTYASLAKWISESKPATDFPYFGEALYLSGRSVVIPASTLIKFGVNEMDAVRLTSSIYGFFSLCVFAFMCSRFLQLTTSGVEENKKSERFVVPLLLVYAFLPSHFLWSNLGLRESPNEFWLIMTFNGVFLLFREKQNHRIWLALSICFSIICTFSSRTQVGWILALSLITYSCFKLREKSSYVLIAASVAGLMGGHVVTTPTGLLSTDVYVAKISKPATTLDPKTSLIDGDEVKASKLCGPTIKEIFLDGKIYICSKTSTILKENRSTNLLEEGSNLIKGLSTKQVSNQVGAASMINRITCPWDESSDIGIYGCLAFRAPYMTLTFLFRPLPFIDTTSQSSTFAAVENVFWILMFMLILFRISKVKKIPFLRELAPPMVFFTFYVVGAGLYEGNMGTAFRHKSLVLWIPLLLLFALFLHKVSQTKESNGNNSQESAV
jgi:hypothetical protein